MPPLVRRESLCSETNLGGHTELELVVGDFEEGEEFPN